MNFQMQVTAIDPAKRQFTIASAWAPERVLGKLDAAMFPGPVQAGDKFKVSVERWESVGVEAFPLEVSRSRPDANDETDPCGEPYSGPVPQEIAMEVLR